MCALSTYYLIMLCYPSLWGNWFSGQEMTCWRLAFISLFTMRLSYAAAQTHFPLILGPKKPTASERSEQNRQKKTMTALNQVSTRLNSLCQLVWAFVRGERRNSTYPSGEKLWIRARESVCTAMSGTMNAYSVVN